MGCFVRGDKNFMGCFVRGGKLMRDVLSGVAKNGMGCFVPGCFVLHSLLETKHHKYCHFFMKKGQLLMRACGLLLISKKT